MSAPATTPAWVSELGAVSEEMVMEWARTWDRDAILSALESRMEDDLAIAFVEAASPGRVAALVRVVQTALESPGDLPEALAALEGGS